MTNRASTSFVKVIGLYCSTGMKESDGKMKTDSEIIDFMLKDSGQFQVEGHYYIYSKRVYAGGETFHLALQTWWNKFQEKNKDPEYVRLNNLIGASKNREQF